MASGFHLQLTLPFGNQSPKKILPKTAKLRRKRRKIFSVHVNGRKEIEEFMKCNNIVMHPAENNL